MSAIYIEDNKSHPPLKQASPSLTRSSAILDRGLSRMLSNSLIGRGLVLGTVSGEEQEMVINTPTPTWMIGDK